MDTKLVGRSIMRNRTFGHETTQSIISLYKTLMTQEKLIKIFATIQRKIGALSWFLAGNF